MSTSSRISSEIANKFELAMLLEVSAHPKPGNVHRTRDYMETSFEHYLASAVASGSHFESAVRTGMRFSSGETPHEEVRLGFLIRDAVAAMLAAQRGGNTSLGTLTLLIPLAVAAGMAYRKDRKTQLDALRHKLRLVIRSTSEADAVAFYEAVGRAKPGGLGKVESFDALQPSSKREIRQRKMNLFQVFELAASRDSICSEWITNYQITFKVGYPYFDKELSRTRSLNEATVNTYLKILSQIPDTLIARKAGLQKSRYVSRRAKDVLELGGVSSSAGLKAIHRLDEELRANRHILNPGSTADVTAAVLSLALISGYKP